MLIDPKGGASWARADRDGSAASESGLAGGGRRSSGVAVWNRGAVVTTRIMKGKPSARAAMMGVFKISGFRRGE
tara:strand:+ start:3018 stop:3239 length:222 start_codon:yes stop_codon:yes gene_type:complete